MSREAFLTWAVAQSSGKYERIDGVVFSMSPESVAHSDRKGAVYRALDSAVRKAGLPCRAYIDGPTVEVGDNDFVPDAILRCGARITTGLTIPDPLVLVEVLSPSTQVTDLTIKLRAYFQIASVMHYLIVWPDQKRIHQCSRSNDGRVDLVITSGHMTLDPPGISLDLDEIYA